MICNKKSLSIAHCKRLKLFFSKLFLFLSHEGICIVPRKSLININNTIFLCSILIDTNYTVCYKQYYWYQLDWCVISGVSCTIIKKRPHFKLHGHLNYNTFDFLIIKIIKTESKYSEYTTTEKKMIR